MMTPPALLLIDIQLGFQDLAYWGGERTNPAAEGTAAKLLATWRRHGWPVFHVRHSSTNPASPLHADRPGFAFHPSVRPRSNEPVIVKSVNSGFIGTDLEEQLRTAGIETLVIAGLTTQHCVSTTTRMAGNLGFRVYLVEDATAAFPAKTPEGDTIDAATVQRVALANLHGEFATVVSSEALLARLTHLPIGS